MCALTLLDEYSQSSINKSFSIVQESCMRPFSSKWRYSFMCCHQVLEEVISLTMNFVHRRFEFHLIGQKRFLANPFPNRVHQCVSIERIPLDMGPTKSRSISSTIVTKFFKVGSFSRTIDLRFHCGIPRLQPRMSLRAINWKCRTVTRRKNGVVPIDAKSILRHRMPKRRRSVCVSSVWWRIPPKRIGLKSS